MPVRFRCVYCNQLLGIAKRKAGSVVRCTNCDGQIIVPDLEEEQAAAPQANAKAKVQAGAPTNSNIFEHHDIDELLKPFQQTTGPKNTGPVTPPGEGAGQLYPIPGQQRVFPPSKPVAPKDPTVIPLPLMLAILSAIALAGVFFGLGFLIGRMTAG